MAAVASGDRVAFVELYNRMAGRVYSIAWSTLRDTAQTEEIRQEVFLAIWRKASTYDPKRGTVTGWIAMLTHSHAVDRVRHAQAARNRDSDYTTRNRDRGDFDPVLATAIQNIEREQIRTELRGLTTLQRQAIHLVYYTHRSFPEVSEILGVPLSTVKCRVRDGLASLRLRMVTHG